MKDIKTQLITLLVGILLGGSLVHLYNVEKIRVDCTTKYLTTFGNVNYMCYYVGTTDQRKAYLESNSVVED